MLVRIASDETQKRTKKKSGCEDDEKGNVKE
jgi:hypothetical protein